MSKITELMKLQEQMEQLKQSMKPEDMKVEIDELVKQLDTVGMTFKTLSQYGTDLLTDERIKLALSVFVPPSSPKVKGNKIPSITALIDFLGDGEKSKKEIAEKFQCSEAHVNGFTRKFKDALTTRREDPTKRLSKVLFKVAPPKPAKKK